MLAIRRCRKLAPHVVLIAFLIGAFVYLVHSAVPGIPYEYDEADYMYAATRGLAANYLDSPSMSLAEFVRIGLNRVRSGNRTQGLSEIVRESGDLNFYRHAHGALHSYWLLLISPWRGDERMIRSLSLIFPILASLVLYAMCLRILPAPAGQIAAVLSATLYLLGGSVLGSLEIAPQQMFLLWVVLSLLFTAQAMVRNDRRAWYGASAFAALAFCTLEVAFVLIFAIVLCAYVQYRREGWDWRLARNCAALFLFIVIAVNPPALLALHIVKSYLFMSYLAIFRKNVWGNSTLLESWSVRLAMSPLEWSLIAISIVLWIRNRRSPAARAALPFLVYGAAMLLVMGRIPANSPRYSLPFLPALVVFAALMITGVVVHWRPVLRNAAIVLICAGQFAIMGWHTATRPARTDFGPVALLREIRDRGLERKRLLVPQALVPALHYYFQAATLTAYSDADSRQALAARNRYDAVIDEDQSLMLR